MKVLLVCLAVWRATHLVVDDDFPPIAWARERLKRGPGWLAELVGCRWCASVWLSAAVTLATDLTVGLRDPVLVWAAAAAVTPPLAALSDRLHDQRPPAPTPPAALQYLNAGIQDLLAAVAEHRRATESPERLARTRPAGREHEAGG